MSYQDRDKHNQARMITLARKFRELEQIQRNTEHLTEVHSVKKFIECKLNSVESEINRLERGRN